ncbi:hypothetical protein CYY_002720 [Polysphondylium violaceum]|uniref:Uncharacterized protein n=1 Tax=Polysphondylium violaceum TaxID=133409 RepID=A0A8J4PZP1_9MYCE|nr:hypothetical protein CYY_002720 [Polysphondylium violaceum]
MASSRGVLLQPTVFGSHSTAVPSHIYPSSIGGHFASSSSSASAAVAGESQSPSKIISPKKIIIKKYNQECDQFILKNYTTRLILTWIFNHSNPPALSSIPKLNIIPVTTNSSFGSANGNSGNLSPSLSSYQDIDNYAQEIYEVWKTVISFFYSQHCKRSRQYNAMSTSGASSNCGGSTAPTSNIDNNDVESEKETFKSIFVCSVYYSDLFFRKLNLNPPTRTFSVLDIIITSINITIKMWMEEKMSVNKYLSEIFGVSLINVNNLEKYFLQLVDYQLYLHEKDISTFSNVIHKSYIDKINNNNNNYNNNVNNNSTYTEYNNNNNHVNNENIYITYNNNNSGSGVNSINSSPLPMENTSPMKYYFEQLQNQLSSLPSNSSSSSSLSSSTSSSTNSSTNSSPITQNLLVPSSPIRAIHKKISTPKKKRSQSQTAAPSLSNITTRKKYLSNNGLSIPVSSNNNNNNQHHHHINLTPPNIGHNSNNNNNINTHKRRNLHIDNKDSTTAIPNIGRQLQYQQYNHHHHHQHSNTPSSSCTVPLSIHEDLARGDKNKAIFSLY